MNSEARRAGRPIWTGVSRQNTSSATDVWKCQGVDWPGPSVFTRTPAVSVLAIHAVAGIPDAKWGEAVAAIVIPRPGREPAATELVEWSRRDLAGYKVPRTVRLIAEQEMPRTATGKILHHLLRERFGQKG